METTADGGPLLVMSGIVKEFPGVRALDGVDLTVRAGRCTACSGRTARASPP
ncbi:hypothetical protein [Actinomadura keratinilytica]|uniref:hypothetical protein n=1 Tax=Actinomadura keratinilytica TaxID=547461 RepID=UPI0036076A53